MRILLSELDGFMDTLGEKLQAGVVAMKARGLDVLMEMEVDIQAEVITAVQSLTASIARVETGFSQVQTTVDAAFSQVTTDVHGATSEATNTSEAAFSQVTTEAAYTDTSTTDQDTTRAQTGSGGNTVNTITDYAEFVDSSSS